MARSSLRKRPASAKKRNPGEPDANAGAHDGAAATAERERRFVANYFSNGLNGVRAAIDAGFSSNYATAASMASRLLRRPTVLKLIERERAKEGDFTAEQRRRQIEHLEGIAFADVRQLYNADGALKPVPEMDDHTAVLVAGIKTREELDGDGVKVGDIVELKTKDQIKAHELLARIQGHLIDKHEHTGKGGAPLSVEVVQFTKPPKAKR